MKVCLFYSVLMLWSGAADAQPKPMTMAESIAEALRQSPQARAARLAKDAAQVQAERGKPVARPTLEAIASGTLQGPRVTFPRPDGTSGLILPEQYGRLDVIVEQTLYHPGMKAARERYAAQRLVVGEDYRKALAEIALNAQKSFLDVLRAESGVRAAREGVDAATRYQALVQKQIEAGFAKPVDAHTVAGQVAEAQAGLNKAENGLALARLNFNRVVGRPLENPVWLEPITQRPTPPDTPNEAIALALKNRPELLALRQNLLAARAGISLARAQAQPALSARGQISQQTPTALAPQNYIAATLEVRWPIGDGGKTRHDVQEAKAQSLRLEALLEEAEQSIRLEVTEAWQKMREARDRILLAEVQLNGAEKTALVAEKAYEVQRSTVVEVQAAQREVRLAHERLLQAQFDLLLASAEFEHVQGSALHAPGKNRP